MKAEEMLRKGVATMLTTLNNGNNFAEELFTRYGGKMYSIAFRILKDPHDSEDAVMEAFKRILKNSEKFNHVPVSEADALATVYVKNAAIDIYNSNKKRGKHLVECQFSEQGDNDPQNFSSLSSALNSLPYSQAAIIILKYHYGYSSFEIGNALGINAITVRKRLERAKKQLKEILIKEGFKI